MYIIMIYSIMEVRDMSITMDKELLIRIPSSLYVRVKRLSNREYKSISAMIRELLLERIEESMTEQELKLIEKESSDFHKGKGTDWRQAKRG